MACGNVCGGDVCAIPSFSPVHGGIVETSCIDECVKHVECI